MIGERASYVGANEALDFVAGYCVCNDVSEREYQLERGGTWTKGKGCPTFGPLGPWLVTTDEIPDPQNLSMWLDVNGERVQDGSTKTMIFNVAQIVSYVSHFMILEPGDVITTGTPPGVGMGMKPRALPQGRRRGDARHRGPRRAAPAVRRLRGASGGHQQELEGALRRPWRHGRPCGPRACSSAASTSSASARSSVLFGVGEDAAIVAQSIARNQSSRAAASSGPSHPTDRSVRCCSSSPTTSRPPPAGPWKRSSLVAMPPPSPTSSTPTSSTTTAPPAHPQGATPWPGPCTRSTRRSRTGAGSSDQAIADHDTVVLHGTFHGRHTGPFMGLAPTSRSVAFGQVHILRYRDGLAIERWAVPDDLDLARHLGPTPRPPSQPVLADALAQLLSELPP